MRVIRRVVALPAVLFALCLAGCSSSSSKSGAGGDAAAGASCAPYQDLCTKIPLSKVMSTCGISAATADFKGNKDSFQDVTTCEYTEPTGIAFKVWTGCFHGGASDAQMFFDATHGDTVTMGETRHDVSGLGDSAFYLEDLPLTHATLYVLAGSILFYVEDNHASSTADASLACMTDIANEVLALK